MRRAIIHIGMPRTGSTTFQHIIARLRPELRAAGILYPDLTPESARDEPHINHQHLGETLDGRRPRRERRELLDLLSGILAPGAGDTVLLSYEDFIQQQPRFRVPALLNDLFTRHGFVAEAIVVLKPQSEHLNSIYTHRTQLLRERVDFQHFARGYRHSARFAYDTLIQPWTAAFAGRVRAVPVRDRRSDAPLVLRLLAEMDLADAVAPLLQDEDLRRVENRSPGPVAVEVARRLRASRTHAGLRTRPREMTRLVERLARERGYDREKFHGVGPALGAAMAEDYRPINERFAQAVWRQGWDEIVAPDPDDAVNELANRPIDAATERAIQEILQQAAQQFEVVPSHSPLNRPINRLVESVEAVQRRLRLSRWRVI